MKTKFIILFLSALCLAACNKYKYETVKGDLSETRIYTLENGLKVYLSVNKEVPRIQTYIAVRTGSKNDQSSSAPLMPRPRHPILKTLRSVTKPIGSSLTQQNADRLITRLIAFHNWLPSTTSPTSTTNSWQPSEPKVPMPIRATM